MGTSPNDVNCFKECDEMNKGLIWRWGLASIAVRRRECQQEKARCEIKYSQNNRAFSL